MARGGQQGASWDRGRGFLFFLLMTRPQTPPGSILGAQRRGLLVNEAPPPHSSPAGQWGARFSFFFSFPFSFLLFTLGFRTSPGLEPAALASPSESLELLLLLLLLESELPWPWP